MTIESKVSVPVDTGWLADAGPLIADLGFSIVTGTHSGAPAATDLLVAVRDAPTLAHFDPEEAFAFVCGPEVMMRFTVNGLQDRGVPDESIYVSMERNMKCGVGLCGHCQYGPTFICKDGPVFRYDRLASLFNVREV